MRRSVGWSATCTTEPNNDWSRLRCGCEPASEAVPPELPSVRVDLERTIGELGESVEDLREISRGLHPAALSKGGLGPCAADTGQTFGRSG